MSRYVDGYVIVIPKKNIKRYTQMAQHGGKIWMKHGALQYVETVGEDLKKNEWMMSFGELAKPKEDETVVFSFVVYKSRKHRDQVRKKVMSDPAMNEALGENEPMPFDMKKMAYGGFTTIVDV